MRESALRSEPVLRRTDAVALAALFASGAAGLVYEVCWIREAKAIFGATTFAAGSVLAIFFLGIAVGSAVFGVLGERARQPLRLYAAVELGIGLLALLTPAAFEASEPLYAAIYRASSGSSPALFGGRMLVIAAILFPPTFLMGATLPLFCRQYVRRDRRVAAPVGWLYGANTLGALVGCLICGLWLLPTIGVARSIQVGAALSLASGMAVFAVAGAGSAVDAGPSDRPAPGASPVAAHGQAAVVLSALVGVSGFVAIGSQILWIRFLALLVPNGVHAYTLTLAAVLLGIVGGSALAAALADRARRPALHFGALQIAFGLLVLAVLHLPAPWLRAFAAADPEAISPHFVSFLPCALLIPPAILSGASFPLAVRLRTARAQQASRRVGALLALNTLGGIGGSLVVAFWLLPRLGLQDTLALLTGISIASGIGAWWLMDGRPDRRPLRVAASAAAVALWAWIPGLLGSTLPDDHLLDPGDELVDVREGLVGNVAVVRREGVLSLEIDRWWQGQREANHQRLAAHLPMLLHPHPRRVLVVGVGTGQTPGRFLYHPLERLDCVEIEPAVFDVVRAHFGGGGQARGAAGRDGGRGWMDDPRVRLLAEDGRSFLAHSEEVYDLISLELGQLFRPSVAPFYNVELYARARARLAPGGIVSQFLPLSFFETEELRRAIASFLLVFPESFLWYNTSELLLLGFRDAPARFDGERFSRELSRPELREDLAFSHWGGRELQLWRPEVLLGGLLMGPAELAALSAGAAPLRDDLPQLEYSASARTLDPLREVANAELIAAHLADFERLPAGLRAETDRRSFEEVQRRNAGALIVDAQLRRVEPMSARGELAELEALLVAAHARNPGHAALNRTLGELALLAGRIPEALVYLEAALAARPDDAGALKTRAVALHRGGRLSAAIGAYNLALARRPEDAELLNGLGAAQAERGNVSAARQYFERALELEPGYEAAIRNLERLRRTEGP